MRVEETLPTYFTKEEFQKLLTVICDKWFRELITFAVLTGLRRGEITNLTWKDIDFDRKLILIHSKDNFHTKSGKRRVVPMNNIVVNLLLSKFRGATTEWIFSLNGKKVFDSTITHKFKVCVRKSKLNPKLHFHSLRHTFASWLVQDGVSLYEVQKLLGHSNVAVTQVYSHLQPETLHPTVNRISIPLN